MQLSKPLPLELEAADGATRRPPAAPMARAARTEPVASRPQGGYAVTVCAQAPAFEALAGEWNELLGRSHHRSAFMRHEWMSAWWRCIGAPSGVRSLHVLLVRDAQGRLAGVLPLQLERHGRGPWGRRALHFLGSWPEAPEHLDAIADAGCAAAVVDALVEALAERRAAFDTIELLDLAEGSLLLPALQRWAAASRLPCRTREWQLCPYIALEGTFDKYLMTLTQKHRYKVRLFGKRLAAAHEIEFQVASTWPEVAPALEEMFRLHAMRWTLKTDDVSGFDDPAVHAFHRAASERLAAADGVRVFLLLADKRAVAACYCFVEGGRMYFFQPGFDPAFRKLHVGKVLLARVIEYCYRNRLVEFDFLRGTEEYKFDWTERKRPTLACDIALSGRGKAALALAERRRRWLEGWAQARSRLVARVKAHPRGARLLAALKKRLGRTSTAEVAED